MSGDADTWARAMRREFDYPGVRQKLDAAPDAQIIGWFGEPVSHPVYAEPLGGWKVGDGKPALADDDPAVMQAIGRCAAHRIRSRIPGLMVATGRVHPETCGWCSYPVPELLAACDWAAYMSRYLLSETLSWYQFPDKKSGAGDEYHRAGRSNTYTSPKWADFWALPREQREARIQTAQYPAEVPA